MIPPEDSTANASAPADPLLARLLDAGSAEDSRPDLDVLQELEAVAGALSAREGAVRTELRKGELWADALATREAVAAGARPAAELVEALGKVRKALQPLPSAAEHAASLRDAPPVMHIPTGLHTLDKITDGGIMSDKLHVIAGEPNLGKTSLITQMARIACDEGWLVGIHVADVDDRAGIIQRFAQAHGIDRRAFQDRDRQAIDETERIMRRWPNLHVIDEEQDELTVEETCEAILARAASASRRAVLYVDSLQTVRMRWREEPRTDKDRVDKVVRTLRRYTRKGLTIVATCEVPRAAYGGPKKRRRFDPGPPALAAFKASGNIEYALWTGLVMTRIKGDSEAVRVECPKNKQGREDVTFRLVRTESRVGYDDHGEMHEDTGEGGDGEGKPKAERQEDFDARLDRTARQLIPQVVSKLADGGSKGMSGRSLRALIVGKDAAIDRAAELAVREGLAVTRTMKGFERYFLPSAAPDESRPAHQERLPDPQK